MQNRRKFLRNAGLGAMSLMIPGIADVQAYPSTSRLVHETEEDYWEKIRSGFPLSKENITFMNNGTMGPSPQRVIDVQIDRMNKINAKAMYGGGEHEAVKALAELVNASPDEIGMTHNVTEGLNIIAWGVPMKEGDEFIITDQEHVGHGLPWLNRARLIGIKPVVISPASTAAETMKRIEKATTKRTKVIAVPHILCTTGQVMPVKEIAAYAKKRNIVSVVDGAHAPGMIKVDVKDIGCDLYASCCHKWILGPKGTGFIYASKDILPNHEAYFVGAHSGGEWKLTKEESSFEGLADSAHRYYYGTQSSILYTGIKEAVDFQKEIGVEKIQERTSHLADYLYGRLEAEGLEILTPKEKRSRAAIVSFKIPGKECVEFANYARTQKVILRYVPESGLNCIRVSTHIYNNKKDVDQMIDLLNEWRNSN